MHTCNRRAREKEHRRQDILRIARDLFFSRGYGSVTMDDVAMASELSIGTLYLYFKNKDALFYAVVLEGVQTLNEMFRRDIQNGGNGADKLRRIGASYLEFYRLFPGQFRAILEMQSKILPADEESMVKIDRIIGENLHEILCPCIAEGIRDGSLHSDLDPLQTALFMIISMQSIVCPMPLQEAAFIWGGITHKTFSTYSMDLLIKSISTDRHNSTRANW